MNNPPAYLWALIIAGTSAIAVATCVALYGAGHPQPLAEPALVPGRRGVFPARPGLRSSPRAVRAARRPGRHHRRHRRAAGCAQARAGHRPTCHSVVQRVRHHRSGRGRDPRRLTGYQLLNVTPSAAPIGELPLALIPTVTVPLLLALHVTSIITLARAPRPARVNRRPAHSRRRVGVIGPPRHARASPCSRSLSLPCTVAGACNTGAHGRRCHSSRSRG